MRTAGFWGVVWGVAVALAPEGAWAREEAVVAGGGSGVTLSFTFFYGETKIADVRDELTFAPDGEGGREYRIESHAAAVGVAKLLHGDTRFESRGRVEAEEGLLMTLYAQARGRRAPQSARRQGGTLWLRRGEEVREERLGEGEALFDYLSAVYRAYALGRVAAGRVRYTDGWRLTEYEFEVRGRETVQTGLGEMEAVVVVRESERGVRKMWLAPALNYLPARLYVDEKGHEFTTVLQAVHGGVGGE